MSNGTARRVGNTVLENAEKAFEYKKLWSNMERSIVARKPISAGASKYMHI
jgi:hypothetical protein